MDMYLPSTILLQIHCSCIFTLEVGVEIMLILMVMASVMKHLK